MKNASAAGLALLAAMVAIPAMATTYLVTPDGTGDFPTIQTAIDAAVDGDIIELAGGTFVGQGNRDLHYDGKAITVRSREGNPESCTLYCGGYIGAYRRGFTFNSGEEAGSLVEGITITGCFHGDGGAIGCTNGSSPRIVNCRFAGGEARNRGGAIFCSGGASPILEDCVFLGNTAPLDGGAVFCEGYCNPSFTKCRFEENEVTGGLDCAGGAIHLSGPSNAMLTDCLFTGNHAYSGGALAFTSEASPRIKSCVVEFSTSEGSGAGALCNQSFPVFESCTFQYNSAETYGGGLRIRNDAEVTITGCMFFQNDAGWNGGALYCDESDVHVVSSTLAFNDAPSGGGIFDADAGLTLENVIIAFSTTGESVRWTCAGPAPALSCCDFYGNAGGDWVGCGVADQDGINGNFSANPLFCGPVNGSTPMLFSAASALTLHADSPCLSGHHPDDDDCGLIGACGRGCGPSVFTVVVKPRPLIDEATVGAAAVETATWGRIKSGYR